MQRCYYRPHLLLALNQHRAQVCGSDIDTVIYADQAETGKKTYMHVKLLHADVVIIPMSHRGLERVMQVAVSRGI